MSALAPGVNLAAIYRVGRLKVRPAQRRVLLEGQAVPLGGRAFDLLMVLIARRDRVVDKDELLHLVWPGVVVEENNLTVQVSALRKVFGAAAITTAAGHGYQFTAPLLAGDEPVSGVAVAPHLPSHNLPAQRSSFIGRGVQIAAVRQLLDSHRLVTLTGIGGTGKTRLALQVAAQLLPRFADGVYFAELAPLSDAQFVAQAIASACKVMAGDSSAGSLRTLTHRLVAALEPRHCLLVVDNCEHLLDACAELIDALLTHCEHLVILATSREALALEGEQVLFVPPLGLPPMREGDSGATTATGDAGEVSDASEPVSEAMQLYAERARAVSASFRLDSSSRPAVAEICRRLDGIPLAIEFAAARAAHLAPAEVAGRLDDRLRLLGGGRRRLPHQQTLAATLEWSHGLLAEPEQIVFRRLAVFNGGFTLSAAESVCQGGGVTRAEVLDRLASLVAKSLVVPGNDGRGETRYRLLETLRLYAAEKLTAAGEAEAWRARHRDVWLAWLEAMPMEGLTVDLDTIARVDREIDHLHAAAGACLADNRPELLARIAIRLMGHVLTGHRYRNMIQLLEQAAQQSGRFSAADRLALHLALAALHLIANDVTSGLRHVEQAIEASAGGTDELETAALVFRAFARSILAAVPGADTTLVELARRDASQAVSQAAALTPGWRGFCEIWAADVELIVGKLDAGTRLAQAAEQSCQASGLARSWPHGSAITKATVGLHLLGRDDAALASAITGLAHFTSLDARPAMSDGWTVELAPALYVGGEFDAAERLLREGAKALSRSGVDGAPNQFLIVAAVMEVLRGQPARGAKLLGAARSAGGADQEVMAFRTPTSMQMYLHYLPQVREALGADAARRLRDEGRSMTLDEAFAYALEGIEAARE